MIEMRAGTPKRILFTDSTAIEGQTWELTRIVDLEGEVVGQASDGAALSYPVALSEVPGEEAWISPTIQIPEGGQYVARFTSGTGRVVRKPLVVASRASESGGASDTPSAGDTYASAQDMIDRFGAKEVAQLSDRTEGTLVTAELLTLAVAGEDLSSYSQDEQEAAAAALTVLERALEDASTEIDTYLHGRYTLPLTVVPSHMKRYACDMARYYLEPAAAREETSTRRKDAVRWLEAVSKGIANLSPDAAGAPAPTVDDVLLAGGDRTFTNTTLADYFG